MKKVQKPWIEEGYHVFALEGPNALKVERLSKAVGKNKSSFYHHFADLEIFIAALLRHHLMQAHLLADKESKCTVLKELIDIMVQHKIDLLFNRQLRIHRERTEFESCFVKTNEITAEAILGIWSDVLQLKDHSYLAGLVLKLSVENFYLQITSETLNHHWLNNYFNELRVLIREFKKVGNMGALDGSV